MRTKIIHFFVAVMGFLALCSCDKSGLSPNDGKVSSSSIKFGKVHVSFPADTKADSSGPRKVGEVNDGDVSFSVEETVSSIGGYQTKAAVTTTASLGGFNVEGFLDPEIQQKEGADDADKNNLHFIQNAPVTGGYQGPLWIGNFNGEYKWRFGTHHHFWATPNTLTDYTIDQSDFQSASFSYTSNGSEDVILAYTNRYYGKDEDTDNKDAKLHLTFKHALSAVKINSENLVFIKRKTGDADQPAGNYNGEPRCQVTKYEVRGINDTGDCETDGAVFTWSNLSLSNSSSPVNLLANNEYNFVIPQDRYKEVSGKATTLLHLEVLDRQRELTRPFIYETDDVFGTGSWLAGHAYQYNFTGSIIVPKLSDGQTGIDANFSGKPFQTLPVINDVSIKYIKKIKLTWHNHLVMSGASGTNIAIGWEYGTTAPSVNDYKSGNSFDLTNNHISWAFKDGRVVKGVPLGAVTPSSTNVYDFDSELEIDMTNFDIMNYNAVTIWCSYMGSDAGHSIQWNMSNMNLKIIEWR